MQSFLCFLGIFYAYLVVFSLYLAKTKKNEKTKKEEKKKKKSLIRHKDFRPSPSGLLYNAQTTPLKRGGLNSSGRRLISSIGKTKGIAFFSAKKIFSKHLDSWGKKCFFQIDPDFIPQDWAGLESSGQIAQSFFAKKHFQNFRIFFLKLFFEIFGNLLDILTIFLSFWFFGVFVLWIFRFSQGGVRKTMYFYPHFVDKRVTPPPFPRLRIL